jgi:hypothetical protein
VSRLLLLLARLSALPLLLLWVAIAARIARDPGNHIGWSPLYVLPFLACIAVWCLLSWVFTKSGSAIAIGLFAVASMLGLYFLDHFNVLMSYEAWIARGMPERPF